MTAPIPLLSVFPNEMSHINFEFAKPITLMTAIEYSGPVRSGREGFRNQNGMEFVSGPTFVHDTGFLCSPISAWHGISMRPNQCMTWDFYEAQAVHDMGFLRGPSSTWHGISMRPNQCMTWDFDEAQVVHDMGFLWDPSSAWHGISMRPK